MSKKTKIIIAALLLLVLVAAAVFFYVNNTQKGVAGAKTITVVVTHADGSQKELTLKTASENLLGALQEQEGLIEGEGEGSMFYITAVDGEAASWEADQAFWSITKDGVWLETGAHDTMIQDGEHYELTYTVSEG